MIIMENMQDTSIKDLLSERNIVVPEIQREYVWGGNKSVLNQFLVDLNDKCETGANVGFLYSYEPTDERHERYLIDGQQRFTTLLLLAFYLSLKEKRKSEFDKLIFKQQDETLSKDRLRFTYRVRSLSGQFLSELFNKIESEDQIGKDEIKNCKWYLSAYRQDKTVEAMVAALLYIKAFIVQKEKDGSLNLSYDNIINNVKFWYFNVGVTSQGEELYITMNSRGEQLTDSEQIKPLLFAKAKKEKAMPASCTSWGKAWDEWEEFFFSYYHDNIKEEDGIKSVDTAMNNFIRAIIELNTCTEHRNMAANEDIENISLEDIEKYFKALSEIYTKYKNEILRFKYKNEILRLYEKGTQDDEIRDADFLILKSLLTASVCGIQAGDRNFERVYQIVKNLLRRRIINHIPLLCFLQKFSDEEYLKKFKGEYNKDIYACILGTYNDLKKNDKNFESDKLFDEHELNKLNILKNNAGNRVSIEEAFWKAQAETYIKGDLRCLWFGKFGDEANSWGEDVIKTFNERLEVYRKIFSKNNTGKPLSKQNENEGGIDNALIARALLSINSKYPCLMYSNDWGLGHESYWNRIMCEQPQTISSLIERLLSNTVCAKALEDIIDKKIGEYEEKDALYYILKYPNSLQAMEVGYNILHIEGGWNDWKQYQIDILNKFTAKSYKINLFEYLVRKEINKNNIKDIEFKDHHQLILTNNLRLNCKKEHGWVVSITINSITKDKLKNYIGEVQKTLEEWNPVEEWNPEQLEIDNKDSSEKRIFSISIEKNKDLIEEGIKIIETLGSISFS